MTNPPTIAALVVDVLWERAQSARFEQYAQHAGWSLTLSGPPISSVPDAVALLTVQPERVHCALRLLASADVPLVIVVPSSDPRVLAECEAMGLPWASLELGSDFVLGIFRRAMGMAAHQGANLPALGSCASLARAPGVLTRTERLLFDLLWKNLGTWQGSKRIIQEALGSAHRDTTLVRVHVHRLRRKLSAESFVIESDRRRGYRMCYRPAAEAASAK
jgi:hypothetical protein